MSDEAQPPLRYEIKFIARPNELGTVLQWVKLQRAAFYEPYPPRRVNNVYFDTYDLFAFHENLSGISQRSKVRYRWYGADLAAERGTLEVKRRRGGFGWKLPHKVPGLDLRSRSWLELRRELRQHIPPAGRLWLDAHPLTIILNRYHRRYFVSRNGKIRLTVDDDQRVYDQRSSARPNLRRRANLPATIVVELKFAPQDRRQAEQIVQGLPLRLSRNSKYVIGVQATAAGL